MGAKIIPSIRYDDCRRAIAWLNEAFGFTEHLVVDEEDQSVGHAQLVYKDTMLMLGQSRDDEFGQMNITPKQAGGKSTATIYVVVDDVDAHYRQAVKAGAEIVMDIEDKPYGGRGYGCKDLEGHIWSFGDYNPWE